MANSLYITATEAHSGKSAIALGMMSLVSGRVQHPVLFRPVIDSNAQADHYACTMDEALQLINSGKTNILIDKILAAYKKLLNDYDFVLCEGTDFQGKDGLFEYNLNADIAANLGAPVVLVANAQDRSAAEVQSSVLSSVAMMKLKGAQIVAVIANNATLSEADRKALVEALTPARKEAEPLEGCADNRTPLCYVIPASAKLDEAVFKQYVCAQELGDRIAADVNLMTPRMFEFQIMEQARKHRMHIVLPEGEEDRILRAADILLQQDVAELTLLGDTDKIAARCQELSLDLGKAHILNPEQADCFEDYAQTYCELRKKKGISIEDARARMKDATYFGTMMVYKGAADGLVSGAINTTAHTVRPALEFIKTKPDASIVSSVFFVCLKDRVLTFGDCAINPEPTPEQIADIAVTSAETSRVFGLEPRVAMLSYSSGKSGKGAAVDKVVEATRLAKEKAPELLLTGPIQYDASVDPDTARTKMPGDPVAGRASVLIVPDLNTGNNTYKAVQRSANAIAIGPVLQGLRKPVNDLSRGCLIPDIVNTVAITAVQAQAEKGLA